MTNARKIWLTRHGESLYNQRALIGGDSDLSPYGEAYSKVLPEVITSRVPAVRVVLATPLQQQQQPHGRY
jgi:6-phosphofructo-2-kinase/fructose-2,6-biphosphatase